MATPVATDSKIVISTSTVGSASGSLTGSDVDGAVTFALAPSGGPAHGTVAVNADGTYTYTPTAGYIGADSFYFTVTEGVETVTAKVDVSVATHAANSVTGTPGNDVLIGGAGANQLEGGAGNDLLIGGVGNDTLLGGAGDDMLNGGNGHDVLDGGDGTDEVVFDGKLANFEITQNSDGTLTVDNLNSNEGKDTLISIERLRFSDAVVGPDGQPINTAPVANDSTASTNEDTTVTINVADLISDLETPDSGLIVTASVPAEQGTVTVSGTVITFTPAPNFNGSASIGYTVTDGSGATALSDTATISVGVASVNDAPALDHTIADQGVAEDTAWSFQVPADTFSDIDGDALTYSATLGIGDPLPSWLTFNATTQTFSGTPPQDFDGQLSLRVTASDGALSTSDTFTLTIDPVQDVPAGSATAELPDGTEDTPYIVTEADLLAGFSDPDGDPLSVADLEASDGTLDDNGDGTWTFTPNANFNGTVQLTYNVLDGQGGSLPATQSFALTAVNDGGPTLANALADQDVDEDQPVSFTIPANTFSDVDDDALAYSATLDNDDPLPSWLTFDPVTRTFSGTPPQDWNGSINVKVTASDGALSSSDTFTLTVDPVNDAGPVLDHAIVDQSVAEDTAWSFQVPADTFSDMDGDALTYSATRGNGDPLPSWLTFNAETRTFSGTPPQDFDGQLSLRVTASDGALSASDTFKLDVTAVNDAPDAVNITNKTFNEDQPVSFTVPAFSDVDSALTYRATLANGDPLPSWLSFNAATRTFSGTPPQDWNGALSLKVMGSDGARSASDTFSLTVNAVNDAPTAVKLTGTSVQEAAAQGTVVGRLSTPDVDSTAFTYTLLDDAGGRFALSGNQIVVSDGLLLDYEQQASHTVQVRVSDGQGGVFTESFTVKLTDLAPEIITGDERGNTFVAGQGKDVLKGGMGADTLISGKGKDKLVAGKGADELEGGKGNDELLGGKGADDLEGGEGKDKLLGGKGADDLWGGKGQDVLKGQGGADDFIFTKANQSGPTQGKWDTIVGFGGKDDLDLSAIDAVKGQKGNQAFDLDQGGAFEAGEIRQTDRDGGVLLEMNTDGDAKAEMAVFLQGFNGTLTGSDFVF